MHRNLPMILFKLLVLSFVTAVLLPLFENKDFSNPTGDRCTVVTVVPLVVVAMGTLPSTPAPKPAADNLVIGNIKSSSQIFTTTSADDPIRPLLVLEEEEAL